MVEGKKINFHDEEILTSQNTHPENDYRFDLSPDELNAKLEHSYQQALNNEGRPMDEVFDELERKCLLWSNTM